LTGEPLFACLQHRSQYEAAAVAPRPAVRVSAAPVLRWLIDRQRAAPPDPYKLQLLKPGPLKPNPAAALLPPTEGFVSLG